MWKSSPIHTEQLRPRCGISVSLWLRSSIALSSILVKVLYTFANHSTLLGSKVVLRTPETPCPGKHGYSENPEQFCI